MSDIPKWHPEFTDGPKRDFGLSPEEQAELDRLNDDTTAEHGRILCERLDTETRKGILEELKAIVKRADNELMRLDVGQFETHFDREIKDVLGGEQNG